MEPQERVDPRRTQNHTEHRKAFQARGFCIIENFLTSAQCEEILSQVENYRHQHNLKRIRRRVRERSLDYFVIDGNQILADLPGFRKFSDHVNELVNQLDTLTLTPLSDSRAAINVNITPPGGEYRWHYDRNRVTALLYLNPVSGGEMEFCPRYRWKISSAHLEWLQPAADFILRQKIIRTLFAHPVSVAPAPGRLLVMRGDICLHSVRQVAGEDWRLNLVLSYDPPGNTYKGQDSLDRYLYDAAEM